MIISAFPGVGKTTLNKKYKNVIDLESSKYKYIFDKEVSELEIEERKAMPREKNPDYPNNYLKAIKEAIKKYDIVLTSCGPDIRNELIMKKMDFIVVYPGVECKEDYKLRYKNRGNHERFVNHVIEHFEEWIENFDNDDKLKKIKMVKGETLEDVLIKNEILWEKKYE